MLMVVSLGRVLNTPNAITVLYQYIYVIGFDLFTNRDWLVT